MTRFFFDTFNGENWMTDDMGLECEPEIARDHAQAELTELAREELPNGDQLVLAVRVRHEEGVLLEARLDLQTVWLR